MHSMPSNLSELGIDLDSTSTVLTFDVEKFKNSIEGKSAQAKNYEKAIRTSLSELNTKGYKNMKGIYTSGSIEDLIARKLDESKESLVQKSSVLPGIVRASYQESSPAREDLVQTERKKDTSGGLLGNAKRAIEENRRRL